MLETIPDGPGAYVLEIALDRPLVFEAARLCGTLPAGAYAYAGSAHGSGGLQARIARHLRPDKPIHWHADRLTSVGHVTGIAVADSMSECDFAQMMAALTGAAIPLAGFGSSDCRQCEAHLIRLPDDTPLASAVTGRATVRYLEPSAVPSETSP